MKNLLIYYFSILLPIPILIWASKIDNSLVFVTLLFAYIIYRGFTDSSRLMHLGIIKRKEIWKAFIPAWTTFYFKEMYFTAA